MSQENNNTEETKVDENEINQERNFFQTWFWDKPISGYKHTMKNLWLYITIIGSIVGFLLLDKLATIAGSYWNAVFILAGLASVTAFLWLWKIDALGQTFKHLSRHKKKYIAFSFLFLIIVYAIYGNWIHTNVVMVAREYSFVFIMLILNLGYFVYLFTRRTKKTKTSLIVSGTIMTILIWGFTYFGGQQYISKVAKYDDISVNVIELDEPLVSVNERVYPRDVILSAMKEYITDGVIFTTPDLVRNENGLMWSSSTVAYKQTTNWVKGGINNVIYIPANKSFDELKPEILSTEFTVGENMMFSKDAITLSIKRLLLSYFNVFPTNVQYMKDDNGKNVAVVSLSKWDGILFPSPEYYGVIILREGDVSWLQRALLGYGEIVKKENMSKYKFLSGQNLNSELTTRFIASSFTFEKNWWNHLPLVHDGDMIVTDMPGEQNEYPIVGEFIKPDNNVTMYDFYETTSFKKDIKGVYKYIWVPSDGKGVIYTYTPSKHGKKCVSTKTLDKKITSNKKNYDWSAVKAVEHRPYFKKVDGKVQMYFLSSIVVVDKNNHYEKDGVETVITRVDGTGTKKPIWVNTNKPNTWVNAISK